MEESNQNDKFEVAADLKSRVCETLGYTGKGFDAVLERFNGLLFPEIKKNYLSHLKNSIEDIINSSLKQQVNDGVESGKIEDDDYAETSFYLNRGNIKLFTINLNPCPYGELDAETVIFEGGVDINFPETCEDERHKRILIAHELGHVFWEFVCKKDLPEKNEEVEKVANIFATVSLLDKQHFYKYVCHEKYAYETEANLIEEIYKILYD